METVETFRILVEIFLFGLVFYFKDKVNKTEDKVTVLKGELHHNDSSWRRELSAYEITIFNLKSQCKKLEEELASFTNSKTEVEVKTKRTRKTK